MLKANPKVLFYLKLIFAALLVGILFYRSNIDFKQFGSLLNFPYLAMASFILFTSFLLGACRFMLLIKCYNKNFSFFDSAKYNLIGLFFNCLVPGGVGGDAFKAYYLVKQNPLGKKQALNAVLIDRLSGLLSILLICTFTLKIYKYKLVAIQDLTIIHTFLNYLLLSAGLFLLTIYVFRSSTKRIIIRARAYNISIVNKLAGLFLEITSGVISKHVIAIAILISVLANLLSFSFFSLTGQYMGFVDLESWVYFVLVPIGMILMSIPITPAGLGVGQVSFLYLFNLISETSGEAGVLTVSAFHVSVLLMASLGGIWYLLSKARAVYKL